MKKIRLTIPIPPSVNHCYYYKGNKRIKKKKARDFEKECEKLTKEYIGKLGYVYPEKTKVACYMWFYMPDLRRRDSHNTIKLMMDSIEKGGLYADDRYVMPRIQDVLLDRDNPRVEMYFEVEGEEGEGIEG